LISDFYPIPESRDSNPEAPLLPILLRKSMTFLKQKFTFAKSTYNKVLKYRDQIPEVFLRIY
jgi:hypothetical protein